VTPRRVARAAAQPLALDEAVAWLACAAPTPPELVAALAGARLAPASGGMGARHCQAHGGARRLACLVRSSRRRPRFPQCAPAPAYPGHETPAACRHDEGAQRRCPGAAGFRDTTPAYAALLEAARADAGTAAEAAGAGDRTRKGAPAARKVTAGKK
jgi:hypothetical protein